MPFPLPSFSNFIRLNILVPVVISYILGCILAKFLLPGETHLKYLLYLTFTALIVLFLYRHHRHSQLYILPVFVLTGLIHTGYALLPPDNPAHLYNLITHRSKVTLTGTVLRMPEFDGLKTRFEIEADSILFHGELPGIAEQVPAVGRVRISMEGPVLNAMLPGDHLMVIATANRTFNYRTPGVFDYRLFLASRSVYVTGRVASLSDIISYTDLSEPWHRKFRFMPELARSRISSFLQEKLDPQTVGLYQALLIGTRSGVNDKILENFKATGCMHLLAISGIHMGLLGMMIAFSLAWAMKRSTYLLNHFHVPTIAALLSLVPLSGYAFIAGMNTPVLRALIMSVFFIIAVVHQRQRSIIHIIAAAALLLLVIKPLALFTVSFQLSFSSVLAIAIIYPRLLLLLEQKASTPGWKIVDYFNTALFVSVAATLGSLPFMLLHFNRISLVGPILNILVEPLLCLWSLPIGLVAIPLIFISPDLAALLLQTGSYGISAAMSVTSWGSTIPFASLWLITPSHIEIFSYYGIILMWYFHLKFPQGKLMAFALSTIFVLLFSKGLWLDLPRKNTVVSFLDIGQGNSTVMQVAGGKTVLLDGGNKSSPSFDPGERVIAPFLWKKQIWRLDDIVVSHPHSDHFNGLIFVLHRFKPQRLWINGTDNTTLPYKKLLYEAEKNGTEILTPADNNSVISDGAVKLTAINSLNLESVRGESFQSYSINDQSLVIKLQHDNSSFLFPGDISEKMEKVLLDNGAELKADVLLAPHHGSRGSGAPPFIAAVDPKFIVVSAGEVSRGKNVDHGHLKRWREAGRSVLATSHNGTITLETDGRNIQVRTFVKDYSTGLSTGNLNRSGFTAIKPR